MNDSKEVKFVVVDQGAPLIEYAYLRKDAGDLVAISLNMLSKHCRVCFTSYFQTDEGSDVNGPGIYIEATDDSVNLSSRGPRCEDTVLIFPDYPDFKLFATSGGRYTINVVLIRQALPDPGF
jgi:hypothetical protein